MAVFVSLLILLFIDTAMHLYSRAKDWTFVGDVTKIFIIPLLYLSLIVGLERVFGIAVINKKIIYAFAAFYWLGDVFMFLRSRKNIFVGLGGGSFAIGHCLLAYYLLSFGFYLPLFFVSILVFSTEYAYFWWKARKSKKPILQYLIYGAVVLALSVSAGSAFTGYNYLSYALGIAGVVLFGISDSKIAYNGLGIEKTSEVFIMVTYIGANIFFALDIWFLNAPVEVFIH